jgi:hypothetical protein
MPGFDGIGANEYIVDVTSPGVVDFISSVDTPYVWELNIWYHTLNVGFRTRISGETDFPCITDARVGQGRVYAKIDGPLTYAAWLDALRAGRSYVSDGRSHLMDFSVNGTEVGTHASEVQMAKAGNVHVHAKVSAYLPAADGAMGDGEEPTSLIPLGNAWTKHVAGIASSKDLHDRALDTEPYWHIERARIPGTREVPVEVVVNGKAVARRNIVADGAVQDLAFDVPIERSSWVALRVLGSSHSNPIFVVVGGKPIRASRQSAEWCLAAVNQCWTQKVSKISQRELPDARAAYDHARTTYTRLIEESGQ